MKKIKAIISRLKRVEYRLTVVRGGKYDNTYSTDRKGLMAKAENMRLNIPDYWVLYKQGPMGLPEREIDRL